jgi:hypothetical protein
MPRRRPAPATSAPADRAPATLVAARIDSSRRQQFYERRAGGADGAEYDGALAQARRLRRPRPPAHRRHRPEGRRRQRRHPARRRQVLPAAQHRRRQQTTYPIPHLVFKDRTDPYDALLEVNKYHLWQLGVYENRTLFFRPVDMTDYDWEVRLSDPGVTVDLQGDSHRATLANGIVVTYQDVATGTHQRPDPGRPPRAADPSDRTPPPSPASTWTEITLSPVDRRTRRCRSAAPPSPSSTSRRRPARSACRATSVTAPATGSPPGRSAPATGSSSRPRQRPAAPRRRDRLPARQPRRVDRGRLVVQAARRGARQARDGPARCEPRSLTPRGPCGDHDIG